jgi:hypothetical protein
MNTIIATDEVFSLVATIPSLLNVRPNFKNIRVLCRHFEQALQSLPCPQSTLQGWKDMVMARELYALLMPNHFRLPINPGPNVVYIYSMDPTNPGAAPNPAPLTRTEQATIDTTFTHCKNNFLSMVNIKRACFTAVDGCINNAFKVSNNPTIQGCQAGMLVMSILDQLLSNYGKPTPATLEGNDNMFCCPYSMANLPELLFCWIEECAKIALLGCDPYTECQLINNAICLLLAAGLYLRPFKEWDRMLPNAQTWITL